MPDIKLDKRDIFKCVIYLALLKCECRVGGMVANRQIEFSKKKKCVGNFDSIQSVFDGGNVLLRRISS